MTDCPKDKIIWVVTLVTLVFCGCRESSTHLLLGVQDDTHYGNRWNGRAVGTDFTASFDHAGEAIELSLRGFDIDSDDEVGVYLNGKILGYLPKGRENALSNSLDRFAISAEDQRSGNNILEFKQERDPRYKWGVTELLLDVSDRPRVSSG